MRLNEEEDDVDDDEKCKRFGVARTSAVEVGVREQTRLCEEQLERTEEAAVEGDELGNRLPDEMADGVILRRNL
ncbi:MAG TPA: hypothetical protein VGQ98_04310, partial [Gemmatimonadaceae bacterium]|nr:hypothetical protein [Gemmatimonadaceae bacterium]